VSSLVNRLDQRWYPEYQSFWDDRLFRENILREISKDSVVLDLGAGAGIIEHMNFRGLAKKVCGVDLDKRVVCNPFLDEGKLADAAGIPYDDQTFDVVFSDNVLEHLENPGIVFQEINRVLKPGGKFLFKTPNKWHYMPLISRLTPQWFHEFYNKKRGMDSSDLFPTHYRANSYRAIVNLAGSNGFSVDYVTFVEGRPEYLRIHWLLYLPGFIYERTVNASNLLRSFRILLQGCLRKQS
jgi:SAM-dependent methyltransferase